MHAIRQQCRPKHQVLILKCYPKFTKNSNQADVKPNSSELSYLLFYASSRRSKLAKVGAFLEKRSASDIWRGRSLNVQVTLQISAALLGTTTPHSFPLLAPHVLRILQDLLNHASDVSPIENTLPTWDALCAHQDPAFLTADQDYRNLYEDVVRLYANFARRDQAGKVRGAAASTPANMRYRAAGLEALKSVATKEGVANEVGRQMSVIIPVILQNTYSSEPGYVQRLEGRQDRREQNEKEQAARRRQSMSTVRTTETNEEADPRAAEGTTAEADRVAEEEVGALALACLRAVFAQDNRMQIKVATSAVLAFIAAHVASAEQPEPSTQGRRERALDWSTTIIELISEWTPVQDRFIILVTAVETLIRSPILEEDLSKQLVLAKLIGSVLRSDTNLIGLSVMDVLIGLVQHILLILQLGGDGGLAPHHQPEVMSSEEDLKEKGRTEENVVMEVVKKPSRTRIQLLEVLEKCIADLASHVYYTDQISDMLAAILYRLKSSTTQSVSATVAAIEDPARAAFAVADAINLSEKPHTDGLFSFDTAREVALRAVKDVLLVANASHHGVEGSRQGARIPLSVWEGTQWLLRDTNPNVRRSYVDALVTWLKLETTRSDLRIAEDRPPVKKNKARNENLARRAVSNASAREKGAKNESRSTFLQLLHLAVYEHALQVAGESEPDILLLHLLLATLTQRLGINAVRSALPMVFRLQEDIPTIAHPIAKVRIGALVHGYLWALSETFGFQHAVVGREILAEITRRKTHKLWLDGITVSPTQVPQIPFRSLASTAGAQALPPAIVQTEALKPFDHRESLVDRIADAYVKSLSSPPPSAPSSPGRSFSMPALNNGESSYLGARPTAQLPPAVREALLEPWTREACLAQLAKQVPKSASLSGSRTGSSNPAAVTGSALGGHRHLLAAANTFPIQIPGHGTQYARPPSAHFGTTARHRGASAN
ncbi:plasma membrane localization protein, partial [Elasticomyces elasticus]